MPLMPTGELRRALRAHGHAMSPIVQVGKAGVTAGLVNMRERAARAAIALTFVTEPGAGTAIVARWSS